MSCQRIELAAIVPGVGGKEIHIKESIVLGQMRNERGAMDQSKMSPADWMNCIVGDLLLPGRVRPANIGRVLSHGAEGGGQQS